MIDKNDNPCDSSETFISHESHWERASTGGIFRSNCDIGKEVKLGALLGTISDLFGNHLADIKASHAGLVIGINMIPTVNKGDALYHIALPE
jgi:predicted deacylase